MATSRTVTTSPLTTSCTALNGSPRRSGFAPAGTPASAPAPAAVAEVAGDRGAVARARMGAGERPSADAGVHLEPLERDRLHVHRALAVPQLTDVEVTLPAVDPGDVHPAEEDVAGGLHEALPL